MGNLDNYYWYVGANFVGSWQGWIYVDENACYIQKEGVDMGGENAIDYVTTVIGYRFTSYVLNL